MKITTTQANHYFRVLAFCCFLFAFGNQSNAQDSLSGKSVALAKNTFAGSFIIDNQTVMVPVKHSFEFSLQHRFGLLNNGYSDFFGLFAGANIRLACSYTPTDNLQLGFGICEDKMQWDGNLKYAILHQAKTGGMPVSATFYGNFAVSTLPTKGNFVSENDRLSYFYQLILARKVTKKLSLQVAPSLSYFNNVEGYKSADGSIKPKMNNSHYAVAFLGRYMLTEKMGVIFNYDQPLTEHPTNNPRPNIGFGIELGTMGHSFQIFAGNSQFILPQSNNFYNQNNFGASKYCIGFNITRRWYDFLHKDKE